MITVLLIFIFSLLSHTTSGQQCFATINTNLTGQCSSVNNCQGTVLSSGSCGQNKCCVNGTQMLDTSDCITSSDFDILYNTTRAAFVRLFLNDAVSRAGICGNCQAKAAFLAIAATMTNNFQTDEATGTSAEFTNDDTKYGNNQTGDGSRFRRRGLFGLRGRDMYTRLQTLQPQYQTVSNPESAALLENAAVIASLLWNNPDLQSGSNLTQYADGTFYGFSMLWYKLTGDIELLSNATQYYSKFLRQLKCGGDLYPGQGPVCQYNSTHQGSCSADCIKGLEESGEFCGCSGGTGPRCPNSPVHIRCCIDTCTQDLKMDAGFVLDASGSVGSDNYELQLEFTKDLLHRLNVGANKTHVGIINYSSFYETLTWLNTDYSLPQKLTAVDNAIYFGGGTNTAGALQQANTVFSPARGLRSAEQGATSVLFVITDGMSADRDATIQAAAILKNKGITIVSVGVGSGPDLNELYAICTQPASENYFSMSNYAALNQKLGQFTSRTCSEPAPLPVNTTITGEVSKDKYKFLRIEVISVGNKILIKVKLFNGKVKLFYSFTSRNPKDPNDFDNYQTSTKNLMHSSQLISKTTKNQNGEETLEIDKPNSNVDYVYLGIKGVEAENKFEVNFDDCTKVDCTKGDYKPPDGSAMKSKLMLVVFIPTLLFSFIHKFST